MNFERDDHEKGIMSAVLIASKPEPVLTGRHREQLAKELRLKSERTVSNDEAPWCIQTYLGAIAAVLIAAVLIGPFAPAEDSHDLTRPDDLSVFDGASAGVSYELKPLNWSATFKTAPSYFRSILPAVAKTPVVPRKNFGDLKF